MTAKRQIKKNKKYKIGDLWLVQKLPPLLFIYTDMGWIVSQGSLEADLWLIESRERLAKKGLGGALYKSDKPPPGARRLV